MLRRGATVLALTMGDAAGVGPEVLVKALGHTVPRVKNAVFLVVGDPARLRKVQRRLEVRLHERRVRLRELPGVFHRWETSIFVLREAADMGAHECVEMAVGLIERGVAHALVTMPARKRASAAGAVGHTELLSRLTKTDGVGMLLLHGRLRVMPLTLHVPLRSVPGALTVDGVCEAVRLLDEGLRGCFDFVSPRIGVAALNPHAGEGGLVGEEEREVLAPAVSRLQAENIRVTGPEDCHLLVRAMVRGRLDAALTLYHDQALMPFKLLCGNRGTNLTLGLPFVRTSPLHGTADDIAGAGVADHRGAMDAIATALALARRARG